MKCSDFFVMNRDANHLDDYPQYVNGVFRDSIRRGMRSNCRYYDFWEGMCTHLKTHCTCSCFLCRTDTNRIMIVTTPYQSPKSPELYVRKLYYPPDEIEWQRDHMEMSNESK